MINVRIVHSFQSPFHSSIAMRCTDYIVSQQAVAVQVSGYKVRGTERKVQARSKPLDTAGRLLSYVLHTQGWYVSASISYIVSFAPAIQDSPWQVCTQSLV